MRWWITEFGYRIRIKLICVIGKMMGFQNAKIELSSNERNSSWNIAFNAAAVAGTYVPLQDKVLEAIETKEEECISI